MAEDSAIVGRKTFFIAQDGVLISDACLERLMSHGYEAYGLSDISASMLKKKVEDVIRLFPELEPAVKEQLNRKIYDIISAGRKDAMEVAFAS